MVMKRLQYLLFGLLLMAVMGLIAISLFKINLARGYYTQLHEITLNPLGLKAYSMTANTNDQPLIVFYGDSRAFSWPQPDGISDYQFMNRGIGAQTTAQNLLRYPFHVAPLHPQLLILQVGINDLKTIPLLPERKSEIIQNTQANIRSIVEMALEENATVILTTIFPVGDVPLERQLFWSDDVQVAVDEVNEFIHRLESEDVVVLDAFAILADDRGIMRPEYGEDTLHINAAGYAALNQSLSQLLKERGIT
jgi:lysophospholipase L1-like esterase